MRFIKHAAEISVRNIDEGASGHQPNGRRHSELLPNNLRCITAEPNGCGTTNLLISLIESENGVKFENLYIYSKSLEQDKYRYL